MTYEHESLVRSMQTRSCDANLIDMSQERPISFMACKEFSLSEYSGTPRLAALPGQPLLRAYLELDTRLLKQRRTCYFDFLPHLTTCHNHPLQNRS